MTEVLVSVRSAEEAAAALAGGADIIDVKEPHRGPLGAADAAVIRDIAAVIGSRPLSAACGELAEWNGVAADLPAGALAKIGPAGLAFAAWSARWDAWRQALPPQVSPVAVAYADYAAANAPDPRAIAEFAAGRTSWLLIDTWDKTGGGLFDVVARDVLREWLRIAREGDLQIALAGALRREQWVLLSELRPNVVAVRGAVCRGERVGDRLGALDAARVREWTTFWQTFSDRVVNHSPATK